MVGVAGADGLMAPFERVCTAMLPDKSRPRSTPMAARFALPVRRSWWPAFTGSFPDGG